MLCLPVNIINMCTNNIKPPQGRVENGGEGGARHSKGFQGGGGLTKKHGKFTSTAMHRET